MLGACRLIPLSTSLLKQHPSTLLNLRRNPLIPQQPMLSNHAQYIGNYQPPCGTVTFPLLVHLLCGSDPDAVVLLHLEVPPCDPHLCLQSSRRKSANYANNTCRLVIPTTKRIIKVIADVATQVGCPPSATGCGKNVRVVDNKNIQVLPQSAFIAL